MGELATAKRKLGFAPCQGEAGGIIDGTKEQELARLAYALNGQKDGSVFVEVDAFLDSQGHWQIKHLRRAYRDEGERCADPVAEYVWKGQDAQMLWQLEVTRRHVVLREANKRSLNFFVYKPFIRNNLGVWTYSAKNKTGNIDISIYAERCGDAASGKVYEFRVELTHLGTAFKGCAWLGNPKLP